MPLRLVLPSAARPNIVSISDSNSSAGVISATKRSSFSPALQNLCAVPGSIVSVSPGRAVIVSCPSSSPSVPERTSKRSVW
jgi:hypothetical protein